MASFFAGAKKGFKSMVSKAQTLTSPTAGATAAPVANVVRCVIEGELEHSKDKGKSWSPTFVMVRPVERAHASPFHTRTQSRGWRSVFPAGGQLSLVTAERRGVILLRPLLRPVPVPTLLDTCSAQSHS